MSEDKLGEKAKLEAEISRSLSVVKMKEVHKQIEEVEKSRRRSVILSIVERLNVNIALFGGAISEFTKNWSRLPNNILNAELFKDKPSADLDYLAKKYESIYFDLQKNIDVKEEDFSKLFPKVSMNFTSINNMILTLSCVAAQMLDMKAYCLRLL